MIQHKHFYLSTSAKLQSLLFQWDNSLLGWHSFAFPFILLEFYLHFRVSDLPAQFALSSTPLITLSPTLPCSSPHLSPFFGSELHSLTHPLPFLPAPSLLWWDPDVQLLWRTTAPQSLHGHPPFPVWALVPSDKPYNLHQNRNLKPVNRSWEDWTEP